MLSKLLLNILNIWSLTPATLFVSYPQLAHNCTCLLYSKGDSPGFTVLMWWPEIHFYGILKVRVRILPFSTQNAEKKAAAKLADNLTFHDPCTFLSSVKQYEQVGKNKQLKGGLWGNSGGLGVNRWIKKREGESRHRMWSIVSKADDRSKRMNIDL